MKEVTKRLSEDLYWAQRVAVTIEAHLRNAWEISRDHCKGASQLALVEKHLSDAKQRASFLVSILDEIGSKA